MPNTDALADRSWRLRRCDSSTAERDRRDAEKMQKMRGVNHRIEFMPVWWHLTLSPLLHLTGAFFPAGEVAKIS